MQIRVLHEIRYRSEHETLMRRIPLVLNGYPGQIEISRLICRGESREPKFVAFFAPLAIICTVEDRERQRKGVRRIPKMFTLSRFVRSQPRTIAQSTVRAFIPTFFPSIVGGDKESLFSVSNSLCPLPRILYVDLRFLYLSLCAERLGCY